ncbi:MAG: helix-turn-helix transcriptional regulator [Lachnospiraceae bacterium]|nr:helix-turn-helix transcriptional regulator [Lachnospiraceae bacterium]MBQ8232307.1 helix-turn-helix transcriptional regulator [Lachnospiraceae bacterium]
MRNKSFFKKMLLSCIATLIVPIITFILLYFQAYHTFTEQILISNRNTLNQFFELIDMTLKEMRDVEITVSRQGICREYAIDASNGQMNFTYKVQEIIELLQKECDEKYSDFFIYYPNNGRVISGYNGSLAIEDYYTIFYEKYDCPDKFNAIIECQKKKPTLFAIPCNEKESLVCLAMRKTFLEKPQKDYIVVQVINPEYMSKIMNGSFLPQSGSFVLFDKDKNCLQSTNEFWEYHLNDYEGTELPYETKVGDTTYLMQVKEGASVNGYYAYATSSDYFETVLGNMRFICSVGSVACILVSIAIAYYYAKRTYSPFENMLRKLEEQKLLKYDSSETSELDFFAKILDEESNEKNRLYRKNKAADIDQYLLALLEGNLDGIEAKENNSALRGIVFSTNQFQVALIYINRCQKKYKELQGFIIKNIFEELCNRKNRGYVVRMATDKYAVLVNVCEDRNHGEYGDIWIEGKKFIEEHFGMIASVAIGEVHEGIEGIYESVTEADKTMEYRYLFGEGSIICYDRIKDREFSYPFMAESRLFKMIISYMKETVPNKDAEQFVSDIMDMYGINKEASLETIECFKYELLDGINKAIMYSNDIIENRKEMVEVLFSQQSLEKFREELILLLELLHKKEQESAKREDICTITRKYIIDNYKNSYLSVAMIGEEMKLSSPYLSRLFKEKYGISITEYISRVRVDKAKEDLKNTSKSIKQIAEENGFLSSTVFISTFKRYEGITPGSYKKNII